MHPTETCYLNPKLNACLLADGTGQSVFCREMVYGGELLAVWGGRVVDSNQLRLVDARQQAAALQVENGLYLAPPGSPEPAHAFTHSCEPNAGLRGQLALVALQEIQTGEEVCMDYATLYSDLYDEFSCQCGASSCRQQIHGDDWRRPELWERYSGHFSPYLTRRIEQLRAGLEPDIGPLVINSAPPYIPALQTHYLSPKLSVWKTTRLDQNGVFAVEAIATGEVLTVWGGTIVSYAQLMQLDETQRLLAVQVEEGLHLAPFAAPEPADYFNHSCRPNAGLDGQNCLVAMRPIALGEEVCFDYATSDSTPYDEFLCGCQEPGCRGKVTAQDWRLPELIERYQRYFSPYLQIRIQHLRE